MSSIKTPSASPGWQQPTFRILAIIGFVCLSLFSIIVSTKTTYAASIPGGNVSDPVIRQIDIARPAVVRIITTLGGSLSVRFTTTTASVSFPQGGGTYPIKLSGTGSFISAHGDILTADHVVNPPHGQQLDDALFQVAASDVSNYINAHFQVTQPFTPDAALADLEAGVLPSTTTYNTPSSQVYLSTDYTGPTNGTKFDNLPSSMHVTVDRIEQQSAVDAKDVAIIHVSGMDDMPFIRLDDSSGVQEQDTLTIIGFPGNGDVSTSSTNLLTSSVNKIYVSALKTTDQGAPLIQVGGNVEHGDSGGPALDANGNIVGIVSFGLSDTGSTTFLQASDSANALIQQLGLDTRPGAFQASWNQAFKDYSSSTPGHWHKAQQEFQALSKRYQQFVGISPYLSYAQSQAGHEQVPQSLSQPGSTQIFLIGLALVILVIAALLLVFMLRRAPRQQASFAGFPSTTGTQTVSPVLSAPSASPPFTTPFPAQNGSAEHYAARPSPLYTSRYYNNNPPGSFEQASPAFLPTFTSAPPEEAPRAEEYIPFASPPATPQTPFPPPAPARESLQEQRSAPSQLPPDPPLSIFDTSMQEPTERFLDKPPVLPIIHPTTQEDGQPEMEKTVSSSASASPWAFSIPPATSTEAPDPYQHNSYGQSQWIAPCGHLNTRDIRFCRVCGQPVATNATPLHTDNT